MPVIGYEFIKGKLSWVKAVTPDAQFGEPKWKVTIHPDDAGVAKIKELKAKGIRNELKMDDDGYYMTFSRPTQMQINGKMVGITPPVVLDKDNKPFTLPIGNGSDGIVKLEIRSFGGQRGIAKGTSARFESLRVENFIPYEKASFSEAEVKQVSGLEEQPQMLF